MNFTWRWLLIPLALASFGSVWSFCPPIAQGPMLINPVQQVANTNSPLPEALQGIETIVVLGDSITALGGEPGGYVWLLAKTLQNLYPDQNWDVINAGISGNTTANLRARFEQDVLARSPQLVIIYIGVNDVWHQYYDFATNQHSPTGDFPAGVELAEYQAHLEAMIQAAQAEGIQVLLMSPTPIREVQKRENEELQAYITAMQTLAEKYNYTFVDLYQPFMDAIAAYHTVAGPAQPLLTYDGVHPNPAGNQLIAYNLLQALEVPTSVLQTLQLQPCVGMCNF